MSDLKNEDIAELTSLIFGAALDPSKWQDFLDHISLVFGGVNTQLFGHDLSSGVNLGIIYSGYDPEFMNSYQQYYGTLNAWAEGLDNAVVGQAIFAEAMCTRESLENTEFYNDWVLPQEDVLGGGGVVIVKETDKFMAFGGNIRRQDVAKLEKPWMDFVSLITPHLLQAFEISRTLEGVSLEKFAAESNLNIRNAAVFIVDNSFKLGFSNDIAQQLLIAGQVVQIDFLGRVSLCNKEAEILFEKAVKECSTDKIQFPLQFDIPTQDSSSIKYECRIVVINADKLKHLSIRKIDFGRTEGVLVTISERKTGLQYADHLKLRYKLTNSEIEIVAAIANGLSPLEISDARKVSIHTVRNQLKAAMSKMEARRQSDIVRILG